MRKLIGRVEYLIFLKKCKKNNLRVVPIMSGSKCLALVGME